MRVAMGVMIDVSKDFTMRNLDTGQKISAIIGAMTRDSKILSKRKKMEEERRNRLEADKTEAMKDSVMNAIQLYLRDNTELRKRNLRAKAIDLKIDRENEDRVREIIKGSEFNVYDISFIPLDNDLVNSFGEAIPLILRVQRKEVAL